VRRGGLDTEGGLLGDGREGFRVGVRRKLTIMSTAAVCPCWGRENQKMSSPNLLSKKLFVEQFNKLWNH